MPAVKVSCYCTAAIYPLNYAKKMVSPISSIFDFENYQQDDEPVNSQEGIVYIIQMITVVSSSPDLSDSCFVSFVHFKNVRCANIGPAAAGPAGPAPTLMRSATPDYYLYSVYQMVIVSHHPLSTYLPSGVTHSYPCTSNCTRIVPRYTDALDTSLIMHSMHSPLLHLAHSKFNTVHATKATAIEKLQRKQKRGLHVSQPGPVQPGAQSHVFQPEQIPPFLHGILAQAATCKEKVVFN